MQSIILVIHLLLALSLIGIILVQRNESGALGGLGGGGGGGGGQGGFMTRRGQANFLTRTTAVLAAAFIGTSLTLAIMSGRGPSSDSVIDKMIQDSPEEPAVEQETAPDSGGDEPAVPVE